MSSAVAIPSAHRRWLLLNALVGGAVANLIINSLLAWLDTRTHDHVPFWSISAVHPSVLTDTLGVLITLPLITTVLCTTGVRRDQSRSALAALPVAILGPGAPLAVSGLGRRALRFAAVSFGLLAVPAAVILAVAAHGGMAPHDFAVYHVALTVGLGCIVTPLVALVAMTDPVDPA